MTATLTSYCGSRKHQLVLYNSVTALNLESEGTLQRRFYHLRTLFYSQAFWNVVLASQSGNAKFCLIWPLTFNLHSMAPSTVYLEHLLWDYSTCHTLVYGVLYTAVDNLGTVGRLYPRS